MVQGYSLQPIERGKLWHAGAAVSRAEFQRLFGRFYLFRRAFGRLKGILQQINPFFSKYRVVIEWKTLGNRSKAEFDLRYDLPAAPPCDTDQSLFEVRSVDECVEQIRDQGVCLGLNLPEAETREIQEFAEHTPCYRRHVRGDEPFLRREVKDGHLPDGRVVPLAEVGDLLSCGAIRRMIRDPVLREIARRYLGYWPTHIGPSLFWSFVMTIPDDERRRLHQTIDYHYDVAGCSFMKANWYIHDTDRHSGAHVMVLKSHHGKPLRMLLSANQSDRDVLDRFGRENEFVVEGKAGFGFFQDNACFHKALQPLLAARLFLELNLW
jgi:hypothetical protein